MFQRFGHGAAAPCAAADSPLLHTKIAPMETLFRHLKAARALASTPERRLVFNLVGSYPFLHFKEFFNRLLSIQDYPPSQVLFTFRIDEFLLRADDLEELLPAIKAAGHQVAVFSMGIENLSPVENERLNKGITSDQVLKVRQRMASIKARFPDAFDYPPGNLSFILFTRGQRLGSSNEPVRSPSDWHRHWRELLAKSAAIDSRPTRHCAC